MKHRQPTAIAAVAVALAAALFGAAGPGAASQTPETIYATNITGGTLVPVDPAAGTVGSQIPVGDFAGDLVIPPGSDTAYVVAPTSDAVVPVDLGTQTAGAPISVTCPGRIALVPGQARAYVTQFCTTTITPIDLLTATVGTPIDVGQQPFDVTVSADGGIAYVTTWGEGDITTPGTLTAVDVASGAVAATIPLDSFRNPAAVTVTDDGTTAFVAIQDADVVLPVSLASSTLGTPIAVAPRPMGLTLTPDGSRLFVTHQSLLPDGLGDPPPDVKDVTPIDVASRTALPQIVVGPETFAVVVTADGTTAYASHLGTGATGDGGIVPFEVATGIPGAEIAFPGDPAGLAFGPPPPTDSTPPTLVLETSPAAPSGGGGWFNGQDLPGGTLTITATATDDESGVASVRCVVDGQTTFVNGNRLVVQGLGQGTHTASCTGTDNAGNVTDPPAVATYRVDTAAPALTPTVTGSGPNGAVLLADPAALAAPNATDGGIGSGVAAASCGPPGVANVGANTVSCSATDVAGNARTFQATYVVEYRLVGLEPPDGSSARAGRPLHVRVSLAEADGTPVAPCPGCVVSLQAFAVGGSGQNAGPFELRYHAASGQHRFSWKPAAAGTGPTRIIVTVGYPGTTTTTTRSALITLT